MSKLPVAVILLTLDEEDNLPGALENIGDWAAEVFVVDSLSTDRTVDIALAHGARVVQRVFTDFGDQWNFALRLPIASPWTLKLDPDERVTPELLDELRSVVTGDAAHTGYSMDRRLWFMGAPLHVTGSVLRLWRTGSCRFSDTLVNEHPIVDGSTGHLRGTLEHFDSPDLHHWYEKQNRYSTMEAIMLAEHRAITGDDTASRTARRKRWFFRTPFRYQLLWLHCMLVKGAWRDGAVGRAWSHLRQEVYRAYELKYREILSTGRVPVVPRAPRGAFDPRVQASELQRRMVPGSHIGTTRVLDPAPRPPADRGFPTRESLSTLPAASARPS